MDEKFASGETHPETQANYFMINRMKTT